MVAVCFYGIRLQGSFVLFWLVYYVTLCVGIGASLPLHLPLHLHVMTCTRQGAATCDPAMCPPGIGRQDNNMQGIDSCIVAATAVLCRSLSSANNILDTYMCTSCGCLLWVL